MGGRLERSMHSRSALANHTVSVLLGVITMVGVLILLIWDAMPRIFPSRAHDYLGAFPLALIAVAYLAYQAAHRPSWKELLKAILLAVAFFFWAANQLWPEIALATFFNDIAIALFVLDVFLVLVGWPQTASPHQDFAETYSSRNGEA